MSPQGIGVSTTYKTRVALEKPCKERIGTRIGQLQDSEDCRAFIAAEQLLAEIGSVRR